MIGPASSLNGLSSVNTTSASSRWKRIVAVNHKNPDIEMKPLESKPSKIDMHRAETIEQPADTQKKTFGEVVRTAMLVRNWVMSTQDSDDRQADNDTSMIFELPRFSNTSEEVPIISAETKMSRFAQIKKKTKDTFKSIIYFCLVENGAIYYYWLTLVSAGVFYNMIATVIFIFDDIQIGYFWEWLYINTFFDIVFIIDILIQSRTCYSFDGILVTNVRLLWRNYYKSLRLLPDVLCLMPFDLVLFLNPTISLCRSVRLIKGYRLFDFLERTQRRTNYPHGSKITMLILACIILFHWNACVYFLFSLAEGLSEDDTNAFGFSYYKVFSPRLPMCSIRDDVGCGYDEDLSVVDLDDVRALYIEKMYKHWENKFYKWEMSNFSREYSMSVYWSALTITTCGQQPYPSSSPQNMLEVIDTLIGVLVFATIIGGVGSVVTQMNMDTYVFREKMDAIKFYMKYRMVNPEIQERVLSCFMYMNSQHQLTDEKELVEVLPTRLQGQIAVNLHMETLKKVKLFKNCEPGFLYEVVLRMKQQVFSPNDYLCRTGEKAKEMFIVKRGVLNIIDDTTKTVVETLKEGSTFGELSVIHVTGNILGDRRNVSLRSVGYSDVYVLKQDDVSSLLQEYPLDRKKLQTAARKILNERDLLDETVPEEDDSPNILSIDEQLQLLKSQISQMEDQLTDVYSSFSELSTDMKQRVTSLETIFNHNRAQIKKDAMLGLL